MLHYSSSTQSLSTLTRSNQTPGPVRYYSDHGAVWLRRLWLQRRFTGWSATSRATFSVCLFTVAVLGVCLQPACYHAANKKHLDVVRWNAPMEIDSPLLSASWEDERIGWQCIDSSPFSLPMDVVSNSGKPGAEKQSETDAILQRLSLVGLLVMLSAGLYLSFMWFVTDDPELIANACIYFAINVLAIGVFGRVIVGYFYCGVLAVTFVGFLIMLALKKEDTDQDEA